jgi:hypothetical protein
MFGVPVIDRRPVEFCAKVAFHLGHQIAGKSAQIGHLESVVG